MSDNIKAVELSEEDLNQVTGGKLILFLGGIKYSDCPFCNTRLYFEIDGQHSVGDYIATCQCGAIVTVVTSSIAKFTNNGSELTETIHREDSY